MPQDQTNKKIEDIFSELEVEQPSGSEKLHVPEVRPEKKPEKRAEFQKEVLKEVEAKPIEVKGGLEKPPPALGAQPSATTIMPPFYLAVEKVLEEDLSEVYFKMPKERQLEFKKKGEETARKISQLLQAVKVKVNKIFKLIMGWLRLIPGVNKHFLEQEAKIKTDKLLELREKVMRE